MCQFKKKKKKNVLKMSRNVIIGSCGFSIPFEWSIITFFEVIIGCPRMFSEHLMPPRGVEHWLELLMQICINFFSDAKLVMQEVLAKIWSLLYHEIHHTKGKTSLLKLSHK